MRQVNSAFWLALQQPNIEMADLIDLTAGASTFRWTTANAPLVVGSHTYDPFPGVAGRGAEESTDLGVGVLEFGVVNSGDINALLVSEGLGRASVAISRVFVNSPSLGRMYTFRGTVADLTYNRDHVSGTIRNAFSAVVGRWPYYAYQDKCAWRFGGTGCGVNASSYTVVGSVNAGSSSALWLHATSGTLSTSYSPGRFERGRLTITSGVNSGQVRTVRANTGDILWLSHPLVYDVSSNFTFEVRPGCRKRIVEDCRSLYNNHTRFLGFPWIPRAEAAFS